MRSKLSPLPGFVHMKGHLPCRGHCDSSLTVHKLVSRCVLECVRVCMTRRGWHRPALFSPDILRRSAWTGGSRTWEGGPNSQSCWGARNCFHTFINSTGGPKHRRLAGHPLQCAVTELSAGFLWTVCNYLISEFIECSTAPCQITFLGGASRRSFKMSGCQESTIIFTTLEFKLDEEL